MGIFNAAGNLRFCQSLLEREGEEVHLQLCGTDVVFAKSISDAECVWSCVVVDRTVCVGGVCSSAFDLRVCFRVDA